MQWAAVATQWWLRRTAPQWCEVVLVSGPNFFLKPACHGQEVLLATCPPWILVFPKFSASWPSSVSSHLLPQTSSARNENMIEGRRKNTFIQGNNMNKEIYIFGLSSWQTAYVKNYLSLLINNIGFLEIMIPSLSSVFPPLTLSSQSDSSSSITTAAKLGISANS